MSRAVEDQTSSTSEDQHPGSAKNGRLREFWTERLGLDLLFDLGVKKRVPIHRTTPFYFLGGMGLFLVGVQFASGALLSLFYKSTPDQAFESVQAIMTDVDFGWLLRSVHSWGAQLLIAVLILHLLTTYAMRAYRRPREFTWMTGVLLLGLFMAFGFSGYLLPWNQLSFFATRVGTAIVGVVPFVGQELLVWARAGQNVTGDTLARFYSLHVAIFPLIATGLLGGHLYLVQKHGMSVPDAAVRASGGVHRIRSIPFVPDFLLRDAVGWYLALALLALLSALFPWELGEKANPFGSAPAGIKPEWYFMFMFQALKFIRPHIFGLEGEMVGIMSFGFCGLIVLCVPFLDRGPRSRLVLNVLAVIAVVFAIVMTVWGYLT